MNTDRIKQRLNKETSKNSVNSDTYLKINLDNKSQNLPPDEINKVVNVGDRFNIERQRSQYYRILGTINPNMSNPLFNLNDSSLLDVNTWAGFNSSNFLIDLTYSDAVKTYLIEREGWFGYTDPNLLSSGLCNFIDMEPKRNRFSFVPDISPYNTPNGQPIKNWELIITYPKEMDKTHNMVNGGLLVVDYLPAVVSTRNMVAIGVPCQHNLETGDVVRITGTTGFNGDHIVVRTGLDNGDLKPYYFVIDIPSSSGNITSLSRMKRVFGGQESEYYFRLFRKIPTRNTLIIETDDYETYPLAFSENIYSDKVSQFVFNEDINISGLTDNLNRPLSQLYLTAIKTRSSGSTNNEVFGLVSSGIETPFISHLNNSGINTYLLTVPAINKIHNGGTTPFQSHTPLEHSVTINDNNSISNNNDYYGDLVEYNINEVKETILAEVSHRFNTVNRETASASITYANSTLPSPATTTINLGPRQEGYFYKAHQMINIREFSNYIEQGDSFTAGIPDYAILLNDGRYLWRDLLDIGFNESDEKPLDYPFLNGCHYIYNNYCFYLRRQDPFDNWGLYYSKFPADPIGSQMTNKFTTNQEDYVC